MTDLAALGLDPHTCFKSINYAMARMLEGAIVFIKSVLVIDRGRNINHDQYTG